MVRNIDNYISNLKIKSFKGLENAEFKDCKKLNILIGENNAGKTTVLEAVRCFCKPLDYMEYINILKRNPYANFLSFSLLQQMFNQKSHSDLVEITAEIDEKTYPLKIKKNLEKTEEKTSEEKLLELMEILCISKLKEYRWDKEAEENNKKFKILKKDLYDNILGFGLDIKNHVLKEKFYELAKGVENSTEKTLEEIRELKKSYLGKTNVIEKLNIQFSFLRKRNNLIFTERKRENNQDEKYTEEFLKIKYSNPLDYLLDNYSNEAIDTVIKNGDKNKITEILQMFEESVFDFNILSDGQIIVNLKNKNEEKISIEISNFGDGMKKALVLISKLISCENGILLIDELETGIHKDVMGKIFSYILKEAEKYNVQLFVATHSFEAIETLLKTCSESLEDISLYRLEHYQDNIYVKNFSGERAYDLVVKEGRDLR